MAETAENSRAFGAAAFGPCYLFLAATGLGGAPPI